MGDLKMNKFLMLILLGVLLPAIAVAETRFPTEMSRSSSAAGVTRKLGRGIANVGLGWVELFKGIQSVSEEKGFWAGATWGPLYGAMNAVHRTAVGVGETLTFPAPGPNKYEPVLEPEFVLEN